MRKIEKIILHCSASYFGSTRTIDGWHRQRGFNEIGYHFVVLNGVPYHGATYNMALDGSIEVGRQINKIGAHTRGHNATSIGICCVGDTDFTVRQFAGLKVLVRELLYQYDLPLSSVIGHCDVSGKTCPNFDVAAFRDFMRGNSYLSEVTAVEKLL